MKESKRGKASEVGMISNLPDPVLHLILSRLPTTEEAIRTSILSKRWRYLWTSIPSVYIHDYHALMNPLLEFNKTKFEKFVCRVLEINSTDFDSVHLSCMHPHDMSTVGRWIDAAVRRNVKLLDLTFCVEDENLDFKFPQSIVTCGSLEVLKLSLSADCLSLPKVVTGFLGLRVLELDGCKLSNYDLVHNFLKSLTLLEDLSLIKCKTYDFNLVSISCPKLKNLIIDNWGYALCDRLEICCPELVFLEIFGFMPKDIIFESLDSLKKAVIHPEDIYEWFGKGVCDLLAGISHVESLSIRTGPIKEDISIENLHISLPKLKTLELTATTKDTVNIYVLIQILKSSPNLESLHLIIEQAYDLFYNRDFDFLEEMECTFEQLKMVRVTGFPDYPDHLEFIKFLLLSTPLLQTMSITPRWSMPDYERSRVSTKLPMLPRASTEAEIIFVSDQV